MSRVFLWRRGHAPPPKVTAQRPLIKWDSQDCRQGNWKSCCCVICSNGFIRTGGSHYSCSLFPVPCSLAMYTLSCNRQRVTVHPSSRLSRIRSGEQCSPVQRFLCVDEWQPPGFIQLQPSSLSSWPSKLSPSGSMRSKRMPWAASSLASFHSSRSSSMVNVADPSVYSTSVAARFPSSS